MTCKVADVRPNSFMALPRGRSWVPVPRSLLHGGDDLRCGDWKDGSEQTFRLREWKAEELGLA